MRLLFVLTLGVCVFAHPASAQMNMMTDAAGFYGGVSAIHSDLKEKSGDNFADIEDRGYGLTLGYQVNEYFAAELAYLRLSDYEGKVRISGLDARAKSESDTIDFSVLAKYPARFAPFVRVGYSRADHKGRIRIEDELGYDEVTTDADESAILWGVGIDAPISDNAFVRLEYGERDFDKTDADVILLGAFLRF